jgi:hypothetical protein
VEPEERDDIVRLLREELREFITWTMEELGGEYYLEHADQPVTSWNETATSRLMRRLDSDRMRVWERDRYAFFEHPRHPSVYSVMEAEDLEIVHYLEELTCDHDKLECEAAAGLSEEDLLGGRRFEESFGVLLASQIRGWMYRLDFCEFCGMIEIWSMGYNPDEIAQYAGEVP